MLRVLFLKVYLLYVLNKKNQMCSYRSIADRVECCMDDLIECFEDYIAKSLLAISVALGIIVASVVYLLKIVSEHTLERSDSNTSDVRVRSSDNRNLRSGREGRQNRQERQGRQDRDRQDRYDRDERYDREEREGRYEKQGRRKGEAQSQSRRGIVNENYLMLGNKDQQISTADTNKARSVPSFDESVLREVGLSCCPKPCCLAKRKSQNKNISKDKSENILKDESKNENVSKRKSESENISRGRSQNENVSREKSRNENISKGKSQNERISKSRSDKENISQFRSPDESISAQRTPDESLSLQKTPDESMSTQRSPDESLSMRKSQYESLSARRSQYEGLATRRSQYEISRHQAIHQSSEPIPQRPYDVIRPRSRLSIPIVPRSMNSSRHSLQSLRICPANNRASCCSMCKKDSRHCNY